MSKRNRLPARRGVPPSAGRPDRAASPREQKPAAPRRFSSGPEPSRDQPGGAYWLYGLHAVKAALANPRRRIHRLLVGLSDARESAAIVALSSGRSGQGEAVAVERVERGEIAQLLPEGAVHQGIAARVQPLSPAHLEEVCDAAARLDRAAVLVLDQVTDPHNVGAILRSAAAFGALAVVLTDRNAPPETGVLAKSASGALDVVPLVRVTNLVRALDLLKQAGFWCIGLAADGSQTLAEANLSGKIALVLGSEGEGLRRLTRERCDLLVRLPTQGSIGHLNVSNAAAVALYELVRQSSPAAPPS